MGAYPSLAAGVDQANALALHFREIQRFQTWSRALRAFVLRYGAVNTISTCKDLCLVPEETSLWDFQRMLLDDFFSGGTVCQKRGALNQGDREAGRVCIL